MKNGRKVIVTIFAVAFTAAVSAFTALMCTFNAPPKAVYAAESELTDNSFAKLEFGGNTLFYDDTGADPATDKTLVDVFNVANGYSTTAESPAKITLLKDREATAVTTLEVTSGSFIELDLNGRRIHFTDTNTEYSPITVRAGGSLTLTDGDTSSSHSYSVDESGLYVFNASGENTLQGGVITGGNTRKSGAAGGGCVQVNGTFTMKGGTLAGNRATRNGGAVWISGGTFTMEGGTIEGNITMEANGGGVYVGGNGSSFVMTGGTVKNNRSYRNGGGINVNNGGNCTISGGEISDNMAAYTRGSGSTGGGVFNGGTLNISGNPTISENYNYSPDGNTASNLHLDKTTVNVVGKLEEGASVGVSADKGATITFKDFNTHNPDDKVTDFFSFDNGGCLGTDENGNVIGSSTHSAVTLSVTAPAKEYTAFETVGKTDLTVKAQCSACGTDLGEIDDFTVDYVKGNCLHGGDEKITVNANVNGGSVSEEVTITKVKKLSVALEWEYSVTPVGSAGLVWNAVGADAAFTYDGYDKKERVRAKFKAAANDDGDGIVSGERFCRGGDPAFLADGSNGGAMASVKEYALTIDGDAFADYTFTNNSCTIKIEPYEIDLSSEAEYRWTLEGAGSDLRSGYIDGDNKYFAEAPAGETALVRSVVRYRTGVEQTIVLNNGEVSDRFGMTNAPRTAIVYSGNRAGAVGTYTAVATLELNDKTNYKYIGEIAAAGARGMTVVITENGTKAVITKTWYIAEIDNGLLSPDKSAEYSVAGWTFGAQTINVGLPVLEHGDEDFDPANVSQSDRRISFTLTTRAAQSTVIGGTFYRYNFNDYINKTMPADEYILNVSVEAVTVGSAEYQAFTRSFSFTVEKGTLAVTDRLNGKSYNYEYDGSLKLFASGDAPAATPLYVQASARQGIWADAQYNSLYGEANMTYFLRRWRTGSGQTDEYVDRTQLERNNTPKQSPKDADTYTVYYKLSAPNYNDYGGENRMFTVVIAKATVTKPADIEKVYSGSAYSVESTALYTATSATYINANESGYTVTLTLRDFNNRKWADADGETTTVKLIIHKKKVTVPAKTVSGQLVNGEYTYETPAGAGYVVDGGATFTQEGTHTVTLKLSDTVNYEWDGETGDSVQITVNVTAAAVNPDPDNPAPEKPEGDGGNSSSGETVWLILVVITSVIVACEVGYLIYRAASGRKGGNK